MENFTEEEKKLIRDFKRHLNFAMPTAALVLSIVAYALYNDHIDFARYHKIQVNQLDELGDKIQYVLRHSTPGIVWLVFCMYYVIYKRVNNQALLPNTSNEHETQFAKNIFLNSLEQFVILFTSQLVLVTYLTAKQTLNLIPTLNLLFFVGRVFFFLGYPRYRSFGFGLTFWPIMATIGYIIYRYLDLFSI